ncbi:MAG: 2-isopropylmalate synthase [Bacteroidaceae bacterium]|nr:2-isopropylmalate synthase [Bacteroidaceae bacterium]
MGKTIEIMDTTLRDGEQTSGVSFMPHEKLMIARALLQDLNVDRIEVASARVSEGEMEAVKSISRWASQNGKLDRVEVLGFVDGTKSVDWIVESGCQCMNLLCKGSRKHCEGQLHKTVEEHIADIRRTIAYAQEKGVRVNVYLEDWSNGMKDSPDYVFALMDGLADMPIERYMLPDTLGVLNPMEVEKFIKQMKDLPKPSLKGRASCAVDSLPLREGRGGSLVSFDFHAHNDYDLAVSNVLAAVTAGCQGIHTSVNGLGERAGNAPLASVQAVLKDHLHVQTNINESRLGEVSRLVESYSGIAIPPNKPITGESVFTQVAGVHADGDNKAGLYQNALLPERFGRKREYALGKNSGKANILRNLEELGLELSPEQTKRVTERIIELGDKKELVTQEDLPYIVSDVLKHGAPEEHVKLLSYVVTTAYGLKPLASVRLEVNGETYEESAKGDGQFDAFVRAIRHIYKNRLGRSFPWLTNYTVSIPPGGRTDALVQTVITWNWNDRVLRTRGLDADQTEAAIKSTIKMLNLLEDESKGAGN